MKSIKQWLIAATMLILAGAILFAALITAKNFDFNAFATTKFETNTHEFSEEITDIKINTATADITFLKSTNDKLKVVCFENKKEKHLVTVENGTLGISLANTKKWYEYVGINLHSPSITVYLPKEQYNRVFIKGSTSDININDLTLNSLEISVSTGDISLLNLECKEDGKISVSTGKVGVLNSNFKNFTSTGSTGDVAFKNLFCSEKLSVERDTGDVIFEAIDANEISIKTDTGDVSGTLLKGKIFVVETNTGVVFVPDDLQGGNFEASTDTGDIIISIKE